MGATESVEADDEVLSSPPPSHSSARDSQSTSRGNGGEGTVYEDIAMLDPRHVPQELRGNGMAFHLFVESSIVHMRETKRRVVLLAGGRYFFNDSPRDVTVELLEAERSRDLVPGVVLFRLRLGKTFFVGTMTVVDIDVRSLERYRVPVCLPLQEEVREVIRTRQEEAALARAQAEGTLELYEAQKLTQELSRQEGSLKPRETREKVQSKAESVEEANEAESERMEVEVEAVLPPGHGTVREVKAEAREVVALEQPHQVGHNVTFVLCRVEFDAEEATQIACQRLFEFHNLLVVQQMLEEVGEEGADEKQMEELLARIGGPMAEAEEGAGMQEGQREGSSVAEQRLRQAFQRIGRELNVLGGRVSHDVTKFGQELRRGRIGKLDIREGRLGKHDLVKPLKAEFWRSLQLPGRGGDEEKAEEEVKYLELEEEVGQYLNVTAASAAQVLGFLECPWELVLPNTPLLSAAHVKKLLDEWQSFSNRYMVKLKWLQLVTPPKFLRVSSRMLQQDLPNCSDDDLETLMEYCLEYWNRPDQNYRWKMGLKSSENIVPVWKTRVYFAGDAESGSIGVAKSIAVPIWNVVDEEATKRLVGAALPSLQLACVRTLVNSFPNLPPWKTLPPKHCGHEKTADSSSEEKKPLQETEQREKDENQSKDTTYEGECASVSEEEKYSGVEDRENVEQKMEQNDTEIEKATKRGEESEGEIEQHSEEITIAEEEPMRELEVRGPRVLTSVSEIPQHLAKVILHAVLRKHGAHGSLVQAFAGWPLEGLHLPHRFVKKGARGAESLLVSMSTIAMTLNTLDLSYATLSAESLAHLGPFLRNLRVLDLSHCSGITRWDVLMHLQEQLEELRLSDLRGCANGQQLCALISGLKALKSLSLDYTKLELDPLVFHVTKLTSLTALDLRQDPKDLKWSLGDPHLASLLTLPLRRLGLPGTELSATSVYSLVQLTELTELSIVNLVGIGKQSPLATLTHIHSLTLRSSEVDDASVEGVLSVLSSLTRLDLESNYVTGAGVYSLAAAMPQLRILNLANNDIGAARGSDHHCFTRLTALTDLDLSENPIVAARHWLARKSALKHLAFLEDMPSLTALRLNGHGGGIEDAGIYYLTRLTSLTSLSLRNNTLSDNCVPKLVKLSALRELDIGGNGISNRGMQQLAVLSQLRRINISHTVLSDTALAYLTHLPHLHQLVVAKSRVTPATIELLETWYPHISVVTDEQLTHE